MTTKTLLERIDEFLTGWRAGKKFRGALTGADQELFDLLSDLRPPVEAKRMCDMATGKDTGDAQTAQLPRLDCHHDGLWTHCDKATCQAEKQCARRTQPAPAMGETPRTDALWKKHYCTNRFPHNSIAGESQEFARQLERELNAIGVQLQECQFGRLAAHELRRLAESALLDCKSALDTSRACTRERDARCSELQAALAAQERKE